MSYAAFALLHHQPFDDEHLQMAAFVLWNFKNV